MAGATESYRDSVEHQSHLYTGAEYYFLSKPYMEGHQYFKSKTYTAGAVQYEGVWHEEVPLLYDVIIDEVITMHRTSGYALKLVKPKVKSFVLNGETFLNMRIDSTLGSPAQPSFYGLLYDGNIKVFARRHKEAQERVSPDGFEGEYRNADRYYLYKDGVYHQVRKKRSVLKVLQDEKKQLRKFIRENRLKFRKQQEESIVKVAQQYDALKN
ncbi:hypothetical protein [Pontibacter litorisediminis]|uniref:hypothetical protein n=1 Tax=Pontibacter litorisediminis TaxID=1846260 RepID=UPI0023ECA7A0|nr:hypothetical protein [Pontibacter litorisediminis]